MLVHREKYFSLHRKNTKYFGSFSVALDNYYSIDDKLSVRSTNLVLQQINNKVSKQQSNKQQSTILCNLLIYCH